MVASRRVAIVRIDHTMFGFLMRGRRDAAITSNWPEDAIIVGGEYDLHDGILRLMVESSTFDEVPIGFTIPDWSPTLTAHAIEPGALAVMELIDKMRERGD